MNAVDIIRAKRDGRELSRAEIDWFVSGVTAGTIPDYQTAALLMAVVCRGMTSQETAWLTDAMVRSGERADLSAIPGHKVDKHSTGGVGDKTSLILAPLAAACGAKVPMMSGRGLGHTGGTVDKLQSIPGFRLELTPEEIREGLTETGCVLLAQSARMAPADRRLYALRDVTGTVESIPLICGSIMSKKIAEGIDALVLDVKTGRGAFMKTEADARRLAEALVGIGQACGLRTEATITAMDSPLGRTAGNSLEVIESIETLKGRGPSDLEALSVHLAARMLVLADLAGSHEEAERRVREALVSGEGLRKFGEIVARQGGDARLVDDYDRLPLATNRHIIEAPRKGHLSGLDALLIGRASMRLGAGRERAEDVIDYSVGLALQASIGDRLDRGQPLVEVHYNDRARLEEALELLAQAIEISDAPPPPPRLIIDSIVAGSEVRG